MKEEGEEEMLSLAGWKTFELELLRYVLQYMVQNCTLDNYLAGDQIQSIREGPFRQYQ